MKSTLKVWTGLGLATALVGAGLAGCSEEAGVDAESDRSDATQSGEAGEGGESGESGEGGVEISSAGSDPIVYGTALAIVEAHAIAARDAFAAGETDAAAEMFAHPVSEVLIDMDAVFNERGVEDFKQALTDASSGVLNGESADQINAHFDTIVAALRAAAEKAPDNGLSDAAIAGGISADMIERAIAMYGEAAGSDRYEPYLDGYGFYKTAETAFDTSGALIQTENEALHSSMTEALALLAEAYPSAERPAELGVNPGQLQAAGSKVMLNLSAN